MLIELIVYSLAMKHNVKPDILVVAISGIIMIFGYFLSHFLETYRKYKERKLDQYLALIRALRMFLNESDIDKDKLLVQRDAFQNAYFEATLFISTSGYKKFRTFIDEYQRLQKKEVQTNTALIKAQDEFINELRKEFKPYETIDFVSYQFSLKP